MTSPIQRKPPKQRSLKILILGQSAVGKTALTVRYVTRRFIGDYDPTLEKIYTHTTEVDGDIVTFEILDTAGQDDQNLRIEENIRWADAFLLVYSITDKVSFEECTRLKFLINYAKKSRKSTSSIGQMYDIPVCLIGNKNDLESDRMVDEEEGIRLSHELNCNDYYEISVREGYQEVKQIFEDVYRYVKSSKKTGSPKLQRESPPCVRRGRSGTTNTLSILTSSDEMDKDNYIIQSNNFNSSKDAKLSRSASISKRIIQKVFKKDTTGITTIQNLYIQT